MAIQGNRYNDPALGAAFSNIANLFAPPSAQDLLGYASAKAKKQEAEQMAWLFANPTDPTAAARSALTGVQSFGDTPEGFGMTDATNRFDITTDASTKLSTNAADNARALATNGADNQRATITSLFGPLNEGQVRPAVPAEIAATQGLPSIASAFGTPKPLSVDQLNAQTLQGMTPQAREAVAFGNTPLETILQGDNPVFSTRPDAIGQTPLPPATGSQPAKKSVILVGPGGQKTRGFLDPTTGGVMLENGAPAPEGFMPYDIPNTVGTPDETGLGTKANITLGERTIALADYADVRAKAYQEFLAANPGVAGMPGAIQGFAQDLGAGVRELVAAYGDRALPLEAVTSLTDQITGGGNYQPEVREALNRAAELAYLQAQLGDPGGEVNVKEWERLYGQFIGNMGGNAAVAGPLRAFREQAAMRRVYGQNLVNGNQTPYPGAAPAAPVGAPSGAAAPAGAGGPPQGITQEEWDAMPPEDKALFQ